MAFNQCLKMSINSKKIHLLLRTTVKITEITKYKYIIYFLNKTRLTMNIGDTFRQCISRKWCDFNTQAGGFVHLLNFVDFDFQVNRLRAD